METREIETLVKVQNQVSNPSWGGSHNKKDQKCS